MFRKLFPFLALGAAMACSEIQTAAVQIEAPLDGTIIHTDTVNVTLSATGVEIVAADGLATPGRAHQHIFLDVDLTPAGEPIPAGVEGIYHLGTGASAYTITELTPGPHRLIAVLALGDHVPLDPWVVDTVHFTVDEPKQEN